MNKKVIIVSIAGVIVVAGVAVAALSLFGQDAKKAAAPSNTTVPLTADLSKDFGACNLVQKEDISFAFGDVAANLQGPDNAGLINVLNGQTQLCVYSFVPGGNIENSFNAYNGVSVEVLEFKDQALRSDDLSALSAVEGVIAIEGLGESAFHRTIDGEGQNRVRHMLSLYQDLKKYTFMVSEPADAVTITPASARSALETVARTATF